MSINKVILIGRIGQDIEPKKTSGGSTYYRFSLATEHRTRDREAKKTTDWHHIVAWGNTGKALAEFLKKGDEIYIEGRLNYWDTQDGKRMADVVVETFNFIWGKKFTGEAPTQEKKEENKDGEAPTKKESTSITDDESLPL